MTPFAEIAALALVSSTVTAGALAAATTDPGSSLAPWVGGSAGVIAVGALGEVTRRLLNGRLVPRETREHETELGAYIVAAGQREDVAIKVAAESNRFIAEAEGRVVKVAEDLRQSTVRLAADLAEVARKQTEQTNETVTALRQVVEDLRDEVRDLRRGGQQ